MIFVSRSQAGQDAFVHALLPKTHGTFIDIGCCHPVEMSNTFALEQLGWRGLLIDSDANAVQLCKELRQSPVFLGDARNFDWTARAAPIAELGVVDYASVDVDEHTHVALANLIASNLRFRVLTVEHDHYQRGDRLRTPNRALMAAHGYDLLCADVHSRGCCFEDWFVWPKLVDMKVAERFRSNGLDWQDVLKKGGAL